MGNGFIVWFSRWYKGIIIGLGAFGVVMLVVLAMQHAQGSVAAGATAGPIPTFSSTASETRPRVAFIGDSYTGGTGATTKAKSFPEVLAAKKGWNATVVACGGGGYVNPGNCGTPYKDHVEDAIAAQPSLVIISGGRNDLKYPASQIGQNAATLLQRVKTALPAAKIIVTSPVWDDDQPPAQLTELQEAVKDSAIAAGATFVDIGDPLVGHADLISDDGIHPNDAGHAALAAAVAADIPNS